MNCMGDDKEIKGAESKQESNETDTPASLNVDERSPLTPVTSVTPLFGRKSSMNCMGDDKEIKGAESKEESNETDTPTSLNVDERSSLTPVKSVTPLFGRKSRMNCMGDKEIKGAESKDREEESNETDTPTSLKRDPATQRARCSCNKKLSPEMSKELKDHKSRENEKETPRRRRKVEGMRRSRRRIHHDDEEQELAGYPSDDEIEGKEEKEGKDQRKKKEDGGLGRRRKVEDTRRSRRRIHHDDEEQELTGYPSDDEIEEKEEKDQRKKKKEGGRGSANPILISVSKKYGFRPKFVARFARKIHVRGKGRFFCENEKHEKITWTSEQTWMLINLETMSVMKKYKQKCKDCKEWTIPSVPRMEFIDMCHMGIRKYFKKVTQPLSKPANEDIVEDGYHVRDLCERCLELGQSCVQLDY